MSKLKLGILEVGETIEGISDAEIIEATIEYAKLAETHGYVRFWLGEHHEEGVAWRSPEILLAIIAGYTDNIKIGSGGMLLPLNSPLRIAQNFKLLSTLFPERIDLGIGRGSTKSSIANHLLNGISTDSTLKNHNQRIEELLNFFAKNYTKLSENEFIVTPPISRFTPNIWILGSSGSSSDIIIKTKCAFSYSLLHSLSESIDTKLIPFKELQNKYQDIHLEPLKCNLAIGVASGENQKKVKTILSNHKENFKINVSGTPKECIEQLHELSNKFIVDEIMVYYISDSIENRMFCIKSFAEELEKYPNNFKQVDGNFNLAK